MEKKTHVIVASVILSILVWLSVSMNMVYSVALRMPFTVTNFPDNMVLANSVPRTILVRVRGTGWQIASSYLSTNASVDVDASNLDSRRVVLTSRELGYAINLGSSAEVVSFSPDTVTVTMDSIMSRIVPILTTKVEVLPRNGFMAVGEPILTPDSVTISGARSVLNKIDAWQIVPRKFKNVMNAIDRNLPLSDSLSALVHLTRVKRISRSTYNKLLKIHIQTSRSASWTTKTPRKYCYCRRQSL